MHRINAGFNAVYPILCAFICGTQLPRLLEAIDAGVGVHNATDLSLWLVVAVTGIAALTGAWRAVASTASAETSS